MCKEREREKDHYHRKSCVNFLHLYLRGRGGVAFARVETSPVGDLAGWRPRGVETSPSGDFAGLSLAGWSPYPGTAIAGAQPTPVRSPHRCTALAGALEWSLLRREWSPPEKRRVYKRVMYTPFIKGPIYSQQF